MDEKKYDSNDFMDRSDLPIEETGIGAGDTPKPEMQPSPFGLSDGIEIKYSDTQPHSAYEEEKLVRTDAALEEGGMFGSEAQIGHKPYTTGATWEDGRQMDAEHMQTPPVKETYYMESVKKKHKYRSPMAKVVAASLVLSLVGGPLVGFSIGAGKAFIDNMLEPKSAASEDSLLGETPFTFSSSSVTPVATTASQSSYAAVIQSVEPSVVNISITYIDDRSFFSSFQREMPGSGSGIIFHEDSEKVYIATNYHVIGSATTCYVSIVDSEQIPASYVGGDNQSDLAVISVLKSDILKEGIQNIVIATFGDSDTVQIGESTIAIGNALGDGKTATAGIVSALSRDTVIDGVSYDFIQTDAAINPGNSGGALINASGEVIGINTAKVSNSNVEGIGFAIPINYAKTVLETLLNNGSRPYLGISGATVNERMVQVYDLPVTTGVFVDGVAEGSGAAQAGLRPGDIIIKADDTMIQAMEDLQAYIFSKKLGDAINLRVLRDGEVIVVDAVLVDYNANQF